MHKIVIAILGILFLISGCASITRGTKESINVETANCGKPTQCTASNKKGTWEFTAPGSVTVKRSDEGLKIRCKDGDEYVIRSVTPNREEMIWGNVLFGGIIGGAVDANSDAHWELPETITIHRENCL